MSAQQARVPVSLTRARQLLALLVALGAVITLLIVLLQDQLIRSWAEGRPDTVPDAPTHASRVAQAREQRTAAPAEVAR